MQYIGPAISLGTPLWDMGNAGIQVWDLSQSRWNATDTLCYLYYIGECDLKDKIFINLSFTQAYTFFSTLALIWMYIKFDTFILSRNKVNAILKREMIFVHVSEDEYQENRKKIQDIRLKLVMYRTTDIIFTFQLTNLVKNILFITLFDTSSLSDIATYADIGGTLLNIFCYTKNKKSILFKVHEQPKAVLAMWDPTMLAGNKEKLMKFNKVVFVGAIVLVPIQFFCVYQYSFCIGIFVPLSPCAWYLFSNYMNKFEEEGKLLTGAEYGVDIPQATA